MTDWKRVKGTQDESPLLIDIVSSPDTVYEHRNIEQKQDEEENNYWEYDERTFTKDEYILYQSSKISSLDDTLVELKDDNLTTMELVLDLYLNSGGVEE